MTTVETYRPPRDELVRAISGELEIRDDENHRGGSTLTGHFARFDEWTEIDSAFEGNFMERIAPGAFKKTFQENRDRIRVLFQHGHDPQVGDKPLGTIDVLEEDKRGARYEVSLLDTAYNAELLPGLREGLYGASFRFSVQREEFNRDAQPSDHNPSGLPERTLKEVAVREFGPVTFPAYPGATAGVRSLTDRFLLGVLHARLEPGGDNLPDVYDTEASAPPTDAAPVGTSSRDAAHTSATWPVAPPDLWEEFWNPSPWTNTAPPRSFSP